MIDETTAGVSNIPEYVRRHLLISRALSCCAFLIDTGPVTAQSSSGVSKAAREKSKVPCFSANQASEGGGI
jgi:hypothetical protein